jgi:hypothetical protein
MPAEARQELAMRNALVFSTCTILVLLGLLHLFWAAGGKLGKAAAVPSVNGVAAFKPSRAATIAVAAAMFSAALVVAMAGNVVAVTTPRALTTALALVLAATLAARAVGDFRLVGFFKTRRDGSFAQLDSLIYSPLCLALAASVSWIVWTR